MGESDILTLSYAIDFGTSNTVITRWDSVNNQPEVIALPELSFNSENNPPLIPSLLYIDDAQQQKLFLGQQVKDRGLDLSGSPRYFSGFKRGIGASIQGFLPEIDGQTLTFEQIGSWYIESILSHLEIPQSLVLTVPVDSFESYRHWLSRACEGWSVEQVRMIDEPTAAALGYGAIASEIILVIDFGGGTFDISLVKLDPNLVPEGFILKWGSQLPGQNPKQKAKIAKVLAKAGKNLGGMDIDSWLVDYFSKKQQLPSSSVLTRLCERLKIKLSTALTATEVDQENCLELDRSTFEAILTEKQFFPQLDALMTQVLQQGRRNGVEIENIEAVLLVGGMVQIPAVQNWIKEYFPSEKIYCDRPYEAIALGALQLTQGIELQDFLYHSYGIRYWDHQKQGHAWHTLIHSGQSYPMDQPIELILGASWKNQPGIELVIGELGTPNQDTEVYFQGDRLITHSLTPVETPVQLLNLEAKTIAQLDPPGTPGRDRLKVKFWVDEQRFLRITVEDLRTEAVLLSNQMVMELR